MSEWQLIETAPKDGTIVLLWCDDGENPQVRAGSYRTHPCGSGLWHLGEVPRGEFYQPPGQVTHWMPAPKGPSQSDSSAKA